MEKDMERVPLLGTMGNCSKDSGEMVRKMDLAFGSRLKEITMKENGLITGKQEQDCTTMLEGQNIEASLENF